MINYELENVKEALFANAFTAAMYSPMPRRNMLL
jgi:hypothetical protein